MDLKKHLADKGLQKTEAGYLLQQEDIDLIDAALNSQALANKDLKELNDSLQNQLAQLSEAGISGEASFELPVTFKKKDYVITKNRIKVAGHADVFTAEQVAESPELIEKILKMSGQQLIIPV